MNKIEEYDVEKDYQIYLEERKSLVEGESSQATSFDKYILTITSGIFGLSITFIKNMVTNINQNTKHFLIISWILLVLSILSTLISFLTSQSAFRKQIKIIEDKYVIKKDEANCEKNIFAIVTKILNILSIIFFITGIIFLFIFVSINL